MDNEEGKVLSQAEIDALMSIVPSKPRAAAATATPPSPATTHAPAPQPEPPRTTPVVQARTVEPTRPAPAPRPEVQFPPPPADDYQKLRATVADMGRQLAKLTNAMQRLDALEERLEQALTSSRMSPATVKQVLTQVARLHRRLDEIQQSRPEGVSGHLNGGL